MIDGVSVAMLAERGGWGVAVVLLMFVAVGKLIPFRTHDRELKREISRGDDLKEALANAQRAHEVESAQLGEILSFVRTSVRERG